MKRRLLEDHYARYSQLAFELKIPFDIPRGTTDSTNVRSTLLAVAAPLSAAVVRADQDQENSEPTPASDSGSDHSGSGPLSEKESEAEEKAQLAIISSDPKRDLQHEEERDDNRLLNNAPPEPSDDGTSTNAAPGRHPRGHQKTGEGTNTINRATSTTGVASTSTRASRSGPPANRGKHWGRTRRSATTTGLPE